MIHGKPNCCSNAFPFWAFCRGGKLWKYVGNSLSPSFLLDNRHHRRVNHPKVGQKAHSPRPTYRSSHRKLHPSEFLEHYTWRCNAWGIWYQHQQQNAVQEMLKHSDLRLSSKHMINLSRCLLDTRRPITSKLDRQTSNYNSLLFISRGLCVHGSNLS